MRLKDLLHSVAFSVISGNPDREIKNVEFDSRRVSPGTLFVAVRGTQTDGHQFIDQAVKAGAEAVVCDQMPEETEEPAAYVQVSDTAEALGIIASNFYGNPSKHLKLVGTTGTNGKTTVSTLLYKLYRELGYNTVLISTVENRINDEVVKATHTTPDPLTLNRTLSEALRAKCTHCFMEVSSHASVQRRIAGLTFTGAVFTNISHDHLDYHKTFDEYIRAKKLFFDGLDRDAFALVNTDDKRGLVMLQNTKAKKYSYALKNPADFKAKMLSDSSKGLHLEIDGKEVSFRMIGRFNAYNLLAVYATAYLLGEDKEEILLRLSSLESAPGRFERIVSDDEVTVVVDYAHTPDALENVLKTASELRSGKEKIITVVGCGGNRDAAKRPLMGAVAAKMSDRVILTSDNPRDEDPEKIIEEMKSGIPASDIKKTLAITDRKEAIKTALALASPHDIILIAGKGHEDYQEMKGVKHPFDDRKIVRELFGMLS